MYLCYLSYSTAAKNKLEKSFEDYLNEIDRVLLEKEKIEEYKTDILNKYDRLCEEYHRCSPIEKSFWTPAKDKDILLSGSHVTFKLLFTVEI